MKQVQLHSLELTNFKGVKTFKLVANGQNVKVYGDNAAGKTTLFDAFVWLLFDKDSQNKKDFDIKTLTNDGQAIHNLEHTVEAAFVIDGVHTSFKKVFKEVWKKKRGSATKEFSGHGTDYFVDDVPMAKKDYVAKVNEIIEEEVFKLITSPSYFNEQLKWQDRRKLLLEIAGDVSDREVIQSKSELSKLAEFLTNKSVEDMKKIIASRKKHINDELEKIPVRIDEIVKMTPETTADVELLKQHIDQLETEIDELKTQKLNVQNGAAIVNKRNELQELNFKLEALKRDFVNDSMQEVYKLQARAQECQGNLQIVESKQKQQQSLIQMKERELNSLDGRIKDLGESMALLRKEWKEIGEQQFEFEDKCECPTCKQSLPVEQVEAARNEAQAQFNEQKARRLQTINDTGLNMKSEQTKLFEAHTKLANEIGELKSTDNLLKQDIEQKRVIFNKSQEAFEKAKNNVPDVSATDEYKTIISRKQALENEIQQLQTHAYDAITGIDESINQLNQEKQSLNSEIAQVANIGANKQRIAELEEQQEQLAEEYEKLEHQTFLLEEFTRTKVDMLNDRINSKFKYARFKLFETQVNGGLLEVCDTTYNGVPYGSGLNNAAKINVGLDIINTLSEHYGITATIFIDNSESVTKFIDTNAQLVQLIVSEPDKQLRVEVGV